MPRRRPLAVTFGAAAAFLRAAGQQGRRARGRTTQRIMDDIAALLP